MRYREVVRERAELIREGYEQGLSDKQMERLFDLTRERMRQLLKDQA